MDNRVDDKFTEFGWQEMNKLLDKEMPVAVARPNRKRLFWWLFFLLCFGVASVAWVYKIRLTEKVVVPDNRPMAAQEQAITPAIPIEKPTEKETALQTVTNKGSGNSSEKEIDENIVDAQNGNDQIIVNNTTVQSKKENLLTPENKQDQALISNTENENNKASTEHQNVLPDDIVIATEESYAAVESAEISKRSFFVAQTIPSLAPEYLPLGTVFEFIPAPKVDLPKKGLLATLLPERFGVEAGLSSMGLNSALGYHAGLIWEYNLKGKKCSLLSGVNAAMEQNEFSIASGNKRSGNTQIPAVDPGSNLAVFAEITTVKADIYSINIPLQLAYQPVPKFRFETGLNASFLSSVYRSNRPGLSEIEFFNYSNDLAQGPGGSALDQEANFSSSTRTFALQTGKMDAELLSRFDLAVVGGVTFFPTEKLGLNLRYNYGMINLARKTDFEAFNRSLRFGVSYRF